MDPAVGKRPATATAHPAAVARGDERARLVRGLFAGIARTYDLVNHLGSACVDVYWRRRLARSLAVPPGGWCLDLCCGTGDAARAVARTGARVIGVDFCRPMLEEGRGKFSATSRVTLAEGDALAIPLRDDCLDAACVAFGIRNVVDPARGIAEMARVVRPGGRVAVLEFSRPRNRLIAAAYAFYARRVLPWIGDVVSGRRGTYRYLPETISTWLEPEELARLMERAGLDSVRHEPLTFGLATLHVGTRRSDEPGAARC